MVQCSICTLPISAPNRANSSLLAEHRVFKLGEIDYIELAHQACAEEADPNGEEWDYERENEEDAEQKFLDRLEDEAAGRRGE